MLLDVIMHGIDGFETCEKLKRMKEQKIFQFTVLICLSNPSWLILIF
jgi:CheY-like chemotaxis protein